MALINGRPDSKSAQYIYPSGQGGVIDNRLPAKDMSSSEEAAKVDAKVENGIYRGVENLVRMRRAVFRVDASNRSYGYWTWADTGDFVLLGELDIPTFAHGGFGGQPTNPRAQSLGFCTESNGGVYLHGSSNRIHGNGDITGSNPNIDYAPGLLPYKTNIQVEGNKDNGFTCKDVIGDPANIIQTPQLAQGWFGYWISVIPDGSTKDYQASRKALSINPYQYTGDFGETWGEYNPAAQWDSVTNSIAISPPVLEIIVWTYEAAPHPTKPSTNKPVLNGKAGLGDVRESSTHDVNEGALLTESFLGKVPTSDAVGSEGKTLTVLASAISGVTGEQTEVLHQDVSLPTPTNGSVAVKSRVYQTTENQLLHLNYAYNQIDWEEGTYQEVDPATFTDWTKGQVYLLAFSAYDKRLIQCISSAAKGGSFSIWSYDGKHWRHKTDGSTLWFRDLDAWGGSWGDDSTVRIIDGQGTFINLNGDTCLYGTNELTKPYGYSLNLARISEQTEGTDL